MVASDMLPKVGILLWFWLLPENFRTALALGLEQEARSQDRAAHITDGVFNDWSKAQLHDPASQFLPRYASKKNETE
uniref:Uncharacterized protein n=1 Tax=Ditylenchus dipsaci TaxID=166011 RepID=A0A915EHP8_9BILA